jgi:hypothetical protein
MFRTEAGDAFRRMELLFNQLNGVPLRHLFSPPLFFKPPMGEDSSGNKECQSLSTKSSMASLKRGARDRSGKDDSALLAGSQQIPYESGA